MILQPIRHTAHRLLLFPVELILNFQIALFYSAMYCKRIGWRVAYNLSIGQIIFCWLCLRSLWVLMSATMLWFWEDNKFTSGLCFYLRLAGLSFLIFCRFSSYLSHLWIQMLTVSFFPVHLNVHDIFICNFLLLLSPVYFNCLQLKLPAFWWLYILLCFLPSFWPHWFLSLSLFSQPLDIINTRIQSVSPPFPGEFWKQKKHY